MYGQAFQSMSHSSGIRQSLARHTAAFAAAFQREMEVVKKVIDGVRRAASAHSSSSPDSKSSPWQSSAGTARFAGQAAATLQLVRRIESTWTILQVAAAP